MKLAADSIILGYADELIAEHKAKTEPMLDLESLEGRLARTLEQLVHYIREDLE